MFLKFMLQDELTWKQADLGLACRDKITGTETMTIMVTSSSTTSTASFNVIYLSVEVK